MPCTCTSVVKRISKLLLWASIERMPPLHSSMGFLFINKKNALFRLTWKPTARSWKITTRENVHQFFSSSYSSLVKTQYDIQDLIRLLKNGCTVLSLLLFFFTSRDVYPIMERNERSSPFCQRSFLATESMVLETIMGQITAFQGAKKVIYTSSFMDTGKVCAEGGEKKSQMRRRLRTKTTKKNVREVVIPLAACHQKKKRNLKTGDGKGWVVFFFPPLLWWCITNLFFFLSMRRRTFSRRTQIGTKFVIAVSEMLIFSAHTPLFALLREREGEIEGDEDRQSWFWHQAHAKAKAHQTSIEAGWQTCTNERNAKKL